MRNKASTGVFMLAYNSARRSGLLEQAWFRRLFLASYFLYKKWYEDPFWALAKRHPELFARGEILDIGANIGYTAAVFAAVCQSPARVYAFEPDQASFATLRETIQRQQLSGAVEIFNMAVGAGDGTLEFWHNDEHSADHRVVTEEFRAVQLDRSKVTTVPVTSVDNFVASRSLQNISFIKIDVQGYELAVCEGMKKTLEKFPLVTVAFEYAPEGMQELGFDPAALLQFFRSAGFQLYILSRSGLKLSAGDEAINFSAQRSGYVDVLCSRKPLV
jgi:FkbM family methyltransferase